MLWGKQGPLLLLQNCHKVKTASEQPRQNMEVSWVRGSDQKA